MIGRRVKIQLAVFTAMTLAAVAVIALHYARVPQLMGIGQVRATAQFSEGGGIYPFANVTYRGVTVGRVTSVTLDEDGQVDVAMSIDANAHVPADVDATVKSVSAIGEQYVDLVPRSATDRTALRTGDVIAESHTRAPTPIAQVLDSIDGLVTSIPQKDLRTTLDEADDAFRGLGPHLRSLTTNTDDLVTSAQENWAATHRLITDAQPALDTQIQTRRDIRTWTSHLRGFTDSLAANDADLRGVLSSVPPAAEQAGGLLDDLDPQLTPLLNSSDVLARLAKDYQAGIEQALVVFPRVAAANVAAAIPSRGGLFGLAFRTIVNHPGACTDGWPRMGQRLGARGPNQIKDIPYPDGSYCKVAQSDPRAVRGSRNLQCFEPGSPPGRRAATIYQCRGGGYHGESGIDEPVIVSNPAADLPLLSTLFGKRPADGAGPVLLQRGPRPWQMLLLDPVR